MVARLVESRDVRDDGWLYIEGLRVVGVVHGVRAERHLLRPFDVLVTALTGSVQVALVSRTVVGVTLLVVPAERPESGMGHSSGTASLRQVSERSSPNE